jgi:hypothetical protein
MAVKTIAGCDVQRTKAFGFVVTARGTSEHELSISIMTSQDGFVHYGVMYNALDQPVRVAAGKVPNPDHSSFAETVEPFTKDVLQTIHSLTRTTEMDDAISETLIEMFAEMGS